MKEKDVINLFSKTQFINILNFINWLFGIVVAIEIFNKIGFWSVFTLLVIGLFLRTISGFPMGISMDLGRFLFTRNISKYDNRFLKFLLKAFYIIYEDFIIVSWFFFFFSFFYFINGGWIGSAEILLAIAFVLSSVITLSKLQFITCYSGDIDYYHFPIYRIFVYSASLILFVPLLQHEYIFLGVGLIYCSIVLLYSLPRIICFLIFFKNESEK